MKTIFIFTFATTIYFADTAYLRIHKPKPIVKERIKTILKY